MKLQSKLGLIITLPLVMLLVFTSCNKNDDDGVTNPDSNPDTITNTLVANAGMDQTVEENNLVTLDGTNSGDSEEGTFTYLWTFLSQPADSDATLNNTDTSSPTFTPLVSGVYEIELVISNADSESTDTVTIMVTEADTGTIELGGRIGEDIVLQNLIDIPGVPDYCITSDIDLDAVMIIEPGVELHFDVDLSFQVGNTGVLIANGTADDRIVFTAKNITAPWRGIEFTSSDDFRNSMDYVDISYAGIDIVSILDRKAALGLTSFSSLSFTNSSITNSAEIGMFVEDDVELIAFANNSFENNTKAPLVIPADQVGQLDTASQFGLTNGENMIEVIDGVVNLDEPTFWKPMDDGTTYFITEDLEIDSELNIMPGVELYFDVDKSMRIDEGILVAEGTEETPIIFTARDNTLPWRGIAIFSASTRNSIDYGVISYAGVDFISILDEKAALGVHSFDTFSFTNSVISNSVSNGMLVEESSELINFENNRFENNAETPLIITADQVHQLDTASEFGTTNGDDYVEILGAFLDENTSADEITWKAFDDGTPYFLTSNLSFNSTFGGLNIAPSVQILVGSDLLIHIGGGFLSAKGESEAGRIVFTAFDPSLPWRGISFATSNIRNELDFVEVSYAGSDNLSNVPQKANIGIFGFNTLSITNSIISNGLGYGLSLDARAEFNIDLETSNTIIGNALGTVFIDE